MAKRTDGNHQGILDVMRDFGYSAHSTHAVGGGFGDVVFAKDDDTWMAEIKDGSRLGWKLTPAQKKFYAKWGAKPLIFDSVDSFIAWHAARIAKMFAVKQ